MAGDDQEPQELQRVTVLGMLDGDGQNNVVLHLFPSAISRVIVAVEWAKAHPKRNTSRSCCTEKNRMR
jgi:hypothetical protein